MRQPNPDYLLQTQIHNMTPGAYFWAREDDEILDEALKDGLAYGCDVANVARLIVDHYEATATVDGAGPAIPSSLLGATYTASDLVRGFISAGARVIRAAAQQIDPAPVLAAEALIAALKSDARVRALKSSTFDADDRAAVNSIKVAASAEYRAAYIDFVVEKIESGVMRSAEARKALGDEKFLATLSVLEYRRALSIRRNKRTTAPRVREWLLELSSTYEKVEQD